MPFLIYKRLPSGDSIRYERLQSSKVGGAPGPIACFLKTLKGDAAEEGWELEPLTLAQFAGVTANGDGLAVLFEVPAGAPGAVCLYQLHRLCGVAHDRKTNLSLDFEVLVDEVVSTPLEDFKRAFTIPATKSGKRLREILQLSGGPGGGDWKWETPAMNLGATVVSPASHSKT